MTSPKIQPLGVTQEGSPTRWKARCYVEGMGWLEAWGSSLTVATEALQALAAQPVASTSRRSFDANHLSQLVAQVARME
jgi:hypothetical protein